MKLETMLNIVLNVNEKFEKSNKESTGETYFDVLHSSLSALVRDFTEEQFNSIPAPYRISVERLQKEIFEFCSNDYRIVYNKDIEEKGCFHKKPEENLKETVKTKCKQTIGYIVDAEEGLNI